jgi:cell division protein FtsI/penicillin-binding protein 2
MLKLLRRLRACLPEKPSYLTTWRILILPLAVLPVFGLVAGQLWWLHIEGAAFYRKRGEASRIVKNDILALRGAITDSQGVPLAYTKEVWEIGLDARSMCDAEGIFFREERRRQKGKGTFTSDEALVSEIRAKRAATARALASLLVISPEKTSSVIPRLTHRKLDAAPDSVFSPLPRMLAFAFEKIGYNWRAQLRDAKNDAYSVSVAKDEEQDVELSKEWTEAVNATRAAFDRTRAATAAASGKPFSPILTPEDEKALTPEEKATLAKAQLQATAGKRKPAPSFLLLAADVDRHTKEQIEKMGFYGVKYKRRFARVYPFGKLAAHLIGHTDAEGNVKQPGVELSMDKVLRGKHGFIVSVKNGKVELTNRRQYDVPAEQGINVTLTIDRRIQQVCEDEADRIAHELRPQLLTIIVSEPKTGKILALTNRPTYDLSRPGDPVLSPIAGQSNSAITTANEPGSVFKLVPISMALDLEGVVDLAHDRFYCGISGVPLMVRYGNENRKRRLPNDDHTVNSRSPTRGWADIPGIVQESSNRGAALVAMRVTAERGESVFHDYARGFGFGEPTFLQTYLPRDESENTPTAGLPTSAATATETLPVEEVLSAGAYESRGVLAPPKSRGGDPTYITHRPMGHGLSATPLQVHQAMCVIANGGALMAPLLIQSAVGADGVDALPPEFCDPRRRGRPISEKTARTVALILRGVCMPGGTGAICDIPGYEVAAKTGTAQKTIAGVMSKKNHVATFSGFFPVENPRIAITVIVNDPAILKKPERPKVGSGPRNVRLYSNTGEDMRINFGAQTAGPAFHNIAQKIIDILEIPKVNAPAPAILAAERTPGFTPPPLPAKPPDSLYVRLGETP